MYITESPVSLATIISPIRISILSTGGTPRARHSSSSTEPTLRRKVIGNCEITGGTGGEGRGGEGRGEERGEGRRGKGRGGEERGEEGGEGGEGRRQGGRNGRRGGGRKGNREKGRGREKGRMIISLVCDLLNKLSSH